MCHSGGGTESTELSVLLAIDKWIYSFHMALFFFVSGYLQRISEKKGYGWDIIKNKLFSILGPYIVFSIVFWAFKKMFAGSISNPVTLKDLLLICIFPLSDLWFLYALAVFYLLRVVLVRMKINEMTIIVLSIALSIFSMSVKWEGIIGYTALSRICKYLCFYFGGAIYQRTEKKQILNRKLLTVCIAMLFVGIVGLLVSNYSSGVCKAIIEFGVTCCNIYAFVIAGKLLESKILQFFGMESLYVFLVHDYAVCAVVIIMRRFIISPYVMTGMATVGGILFSLFIIWICTKNKVFDYFFKPQLLLRHR